MGRSANLTIEHMKAFAQSKGGVCRSKTYQGPTRKLLWQCACGFRWKASPVNVYWGKKSWCPRCARERRSESMQSNWRGARLNRTARVSLGRSFNLLERGCLMHFESDTLHKGLGVPRELSELLYAIIVARPASWVAMRNKEFLTDCIRLLREKPDLPDIWAPFARGVLLGPVSSLVVHAASPEVLNRVATAAAIVGDTDGTDQVQLTNAEALAYARGFAAAHGLNMSYSQPIAAGAKEPHTLSGWRADQIASLEKRTSSAIIQVADMAAMDKRLEFVNATCWATWLAANVRSGLACYQGKISNLDWAHAVDRSVGEYTGWLSSFILNLLNDPSARIASIQRQ